MVMGGLNGLGSQALHMVVALLGGMTLFSLGILGGGDAKFYAGVAAWFGLKQALPLLVYVTLSGLVLLIVWFGYRRMKRLPLRPAKATLSDSLPYGLAIGIGAIALAMI